MSLSDISLPRAEPVSGSVPEERRLSKDVIFELLKNRRRRDVLRYLLSQDGTVTLSELAEQIAAWENDIEVSALNSTQRKRVYVALYQTHLPKMDEAGIIDYDRDRGNIGLSENADLLTMYLDDGLHDGEPWERRYVALSLVGGGLIALTYFGGGSVSGSGIAIAIALLAVFFLVSIVHTYDRWKARRGTAAMLQRID